MENLGCNIWTHQSHGKWSFEIDHWDTKRAQISSWVENCTELVHLNLCKYCSALYILVGKAGSGGKKTKIRCFQASYVAQYILSLKSNKWHLNFSKLYRPALSKWISSLKFDCFSDIHQFHIQQPVETAWKFIGQDLEKVFKHQFDVTLGKISAQGNPLEVYNDPKIHTIDKIPSEFSRSWYVQLRWLALLNRHD